MNDNSILRHYLEYEAMRRRLKISVREDLASDSVIITTSTTIPKYDLFSKDQDSCCRIINDALGWSSRIAPHYINIDSLNEADITKLLDKLLEKIPKPKKKKKASANATKLKLISNG